MTRYTLLTLAGLLGSGLICSVGACGSEKSDDDDDGAVGRAGTTAPAQDFGNGGRAAAGSSSVPMQNTSAGMAAAGMGGQAGGAAGNGSAGRAGGSGGAGGMGGAQAAGAAAEDDIFGGLFDPAAFEELSCEGLLCFETADCAALYPDETTACKFTRCQDFACAP